MISRIFLRLSVAWLVILVALYLVALGTGGTPDIVMYMIFGSPSILGLALSWAFYPEQ